jgi:2-amino-4-hydroxy-6-hydroxymethyldihydropteridine diphosphokinase
MNDVVYIALGSNVGDREVTLARARAAIAGIRDTRILGETAIEETEPIGPIAQGRYLNQMIVVETELAPAVLLAALQRIERAAGRVRSMRWGPRTLDLDIVLIEGKQITEKALTVPHPELPNRDFWQRELHELKGVHHG